MYIGRTLPFSDRGRDSAMTEGFNKYGATIVVGDRVYTLATYNEIVLRKVPYHNARVDKNAKNSVYSAAVKEADKQVKYLHDLESECMQIFNLGINRSINPLYKKSDRSFFGLPLDSGRQPKLTTEAEIMDFAGVIVDGDADRIAIPGATVMLVATPAQIAAQKIVAQAAINARGVAKTAKDTADRLVVTMNVDVDLLILQMWNETETYYGKLPISAMRSSSRDWGVIYITYGSGSVINFTILDFDTHLPIELAEGQVNENGDKGNSNPLGILALHTTVIGNAHVTFTKEGIYQELIFALTIVDESTVSYTVYLKKIV